MLLSCRGVKSMCRGVGKIHVSALQVRVENLLSCRIEFSIFDTSCSGSKGLRSKDIGLPHTICISLVLHFLMDPRDSQYFEQTISVIPFTN